MPAPLREVAMVPTMRPAAVAQYLPLAVQSVRTLADPPLELMCSITTALRLYPETSTAPGLNPYHVALTDVTATAGAIKGHIARAAAGDTSPQLQQAMMYDVMSWPMLQTEMMHNWELYRSRTGDVLGTLPRWVQDWNQQIARGYGQTLNAARAAIGPREFAALMPTVWAPVGANRF